MNLLQNKKNYVSRIFLFPTCHLHKEGLWVLILGGYALFSACASNAQILHLIKITEILYCMLKSVAG